MVQYNSQLPSGPDLCHLTSYIHDDTFCKNGASCIYRLSMLERYTSCKRHLILFNRRRLTAAVETWFLLRQSTPCELSTPLLCLGALRHHPSIILLWRPASVHSIRFVVTFNLSYFQSIYLILSEINIVYFRDAIIIVPQGTVNSHQ